MNKKILIVRGDRQNAKTLSFLLAGSGYQISTHATAGEAVEAAKHQRFDLAITDDALPENRPNLSLVSHLKDAQPALPIFYLAGGQSLETIINCIRAGVTEVISEPNDLRQVIETTNAFLRGSGPSSENEEVTWEDIVEVEKMLESTVLAGSDSESGEPKVSSAEVQELNRKLEETLADRDRVAGELAASLANLEKSKRLVDELRGESGGMSTDSEIAERASELDERERKLREMSGKLSQQKFEVESQLAELEAQKIEFEEAQKDAGGEAGNADISSSELEAERAAFNSKRLEMEARIQDLERELVVVKNSATDSEELKRRISEMNEKLQDSKEAIAEKDFIIQQRDREIENLKAEAELKAGNPQVEELEEMKRLAEIERHKIKERIDQFEIEKRMFEESHSKNQREIQVERRDAEVSLREMQNTIKEEQLKLKVDQASLREEIRQFEQARNNFQEDVQELQSKQAELRKMEAYLQQMEESIKANGLLAAETALPKPDSSAFEPLQSGNREIEAAAESATEPTPSSPKANGEPETKKPEDWGKPNMERKAGRGPLRIGRRSSF